MADDARDKDSAGTTAAEGSNFGPQRKLPKGIVLGKDGKP
jgi:hypothetical protein